MSFALVRVLQANLAARSRWTVVTGIGAVGTFLVGIMALGESATPLRNIAALLILAGTMLVEAVNAIR